MKDDSRLIRGLKFGEHSFLVLMEVKHFVNSLVSCIKAPIDHSMVLLKDFRGTYLCPDHKVFLDFLETLLDALLHTGVLGLKRLVLLFFHFESERSKPIDNLVCVLFAFLVKQEATAFQVT